MTGYDKALPMNTGAEAVETAIKAARKWGYKVKGIADGKAEILVFENNFHGRTTTIVGFSSEAQYRDGFGPFTPGFRRLPYGDAAAVGRRCTRTSPPSWSSRSRARAASSSRRTAICRSLREITERHNALLVADEIQSGLGRTGKMWAFEHEGIAPTS
ncbi:MAG: aminotransferase class III-fold pyridoxal phosphate-dependent enzyme [Thermoanaerobaculia bacterium]